MTLASAIRKLVRSVIPGRAIPFSDSSSYWDERYRRHGNSGRGSYGRLADFKARVVNNVVDDVGAQSIVEWGCGDGSQLGMFEVAKYVGIDVSPTVVEMCKARYANDRSKEFLTAAEAATTSPTADIALSLDVVYHLIEDCVFDQYMRSLFRSAKRYVLVYSSNDEGGYIGQYDHVRDRCFTDWIEANIEGWELHCTIMNPFPFSDKNPNNTSRSDFYIYTAI